MEINSLKPLASFITSHSPVNKKSTVAVYNYLLPSLAFYTDKNIVTIDNGNPNTRRETQFEKGEKKWEASYVQITGQRYNSNLSFLLKGKNNFLIASKDNDLPDSLAYIRNNMPHRGVLQKWVIYYKRKNEAYMPVNPHPSRLNKTFVSARPVMKIISMLI